MKFISFSWFSGVMRFGDSSDRHKIWLSNKVCRQFMVIKSNEVFFRYAIASSIFCGKYRARELGANSRDCVYLKYNWAIPDQSHILIENRSVEHGFEDLGIKGGILSEFSGDSPYFMKLNNKKVRFDGLAFYYVLDGGVSISLNSVNKIESSHRDIRLMLIAMVLLINRMLCENPDWMRREIKVGRGTKVVANKGDRPL